MRKFTFFLALMVAMVTTTFAQVNYTPKNVIQTTKTRDDRAMNYVKVGDESYVLTSTEQTHCYVDKYDEVTFTVTPGQEVEFAVNTDAFWIHNAVFIDFDKNGFTAGVTNQWEPTGDLIAYSFYNNGSSSDENGWNSVGQAISGGNRNRPAIPSYTIPEDATPGEYRIRFTQDWCSIDPDGDADGSFDDFYDNGGAILDAKLVVSDGAIVEPEPEPNAPVVITSVDQLSNAKLYTITSSDTGRGGMFAAEGASMLDMCGVTYNQAQDCHSIARDAADPRQQFAFVAYEGKHYLYSVSEKKFVAKNNEVNKLTAEAPYEFVVVEPVANNKFALMLNGTHYLTASPGWCANASRNTCLQTTLTSHSTNDGWDDGAWYTITEAGDFDATEALAMLAPATPEPVPVTFDIYALDDVMNPSPLEGTVSKLGFVVFAASDNNAVLAEAAGAPKVGIFDPAKGSFVAEASSIMFGDLLGNGMQLVAVQFDGFATPGTYMVCAPAGAFTVNGQPNEEIVSAQFTIPAPVVKVFEVESVTPADKKEVEAINKIEINFTETIALATDNMGNFIPVNLVDENDNVIELAVSDDANVWSKVVLAPATPITAAGTYTLDLSQLQLNDGVCEGSYSWTVVEPVVEPEPESGIDTSKEYYLYSSYNWGMNKGYLTIGTKSGSNYGPVYMANEKLQAFKLTPAADGGYTLSREVDMSGMSYTEYIDCSHSYNVGSNAMSGSVLYFDLNTNNKYNIRSANGYFKADMITYGTDGYAYHVFSNGDMTSALEWELVPATDEEPTTPAVAPVIQTISPAAGAVVEGAVSEIVITFDKEIKSVSSSAQIKVKLGTATTRAYGSNATIDGCTVTFKFGDGGQFGFTTIEEAGEYSVEIPASLCTSEDGGASEALSYTFTIAEPVVEPEPAALEATNATRNPAESEWDPSKSYYLQGVKLEFAEAVKKADGVTEFGCIYNANGEQVAVLNKVLGANGTATYATPYVATKITTAGTYKVVVYSGVILSADGTKEYKGGEFEFTVAKKPATLIPSAEDGLFYNASFTSVDEFKTQQIVVSGADEVTVSEEVDITMTSGENVYTATVTVEDNDGDKVINIVFPDKDYAAGSYTINIPAGAFLVDGVANAEYYPSTFTYSKPQLEITKEWTSWESLFTEKYMMPREVAITINNAESVTVAENMVATLTVGETTYNSTVLFTNEENNYWISFKFAEIQAIYEDENKDFVKGEYTFTVPGGLYTVNGEANVEETITFTYGDAVVEEFSVASISPAVGNVTELSRIEIAFSNGVKPEQLILTNGDERFFFIAKNGAYVAADPLKDYAEITITEPGTYTLDLSELDGLTGDNVFSWTIPAPAPTLNETVVFDFANNNWGIPTMAENNYSNLKVAADYTDGTNTIYIDPTANNGSYIYDSKGFLNLGKTGSKIVLPAFDFAVEKIEVVGHSSATSYPNVDMNVYVGDVAVSTACIGSTATSTFAIAADNQAAGNVYELVIGSNGGKTSSVMYITYIKVYPAENKLEAPVIDLASGVYVGEQTVNAHSATTDIEGVTDVKYYYTIDGNEPTVEDEKSVDGVITITNSCTLKVIVEFTLGDKTYVSASTSAEYIITEEATYHRAVAVEAGNYFLVADGKVAAPIEGTTLPAVEVAVDGNDATAPVYYAITLEETAGGYYIKDVNGNYIYTSSMYGASGPKLSSNGAYVPMNSWTITIADDENSTATIVSEKLTLVYDTAAGVFKVTDSVSSDMILPTLYGTHATGIDAVVNGEAIESIYDLTGRKIEKITKSGIYIVNGKKILVK